MFEKKTMTRYINKEEEGLYFTLPFEVPEHVVKIDIRYHYEKGKNIIDFALSGPEDDFVGASGSDRDHLWISAYTSSPGFSTISPPAGTWNVVVGAYKIQDEGVQVTYEITFTKKSRQLLLGDTHTHTVGSDGVLTTDELASVAIKNNLDFLMITDHNNYAHHHTMQSTAELTLIPGMEWTLFKGHANMYGIKKPFEGNYYANSAAEVVNKLQTARDSGAFVSLNHPFDESVPWQWGMEDLPYDGVEVWNGIMRASNVKAIKWWHQTLVNGKRLPILGGSDFHRFMNFSTPGMPTMCVYSLSRAPDDILNAIRQGHAFITFQPAGPISDIRYGAAEMGDETTFDATVPIDFHFDNVYQGDLIKVYSDAGLEQEITAPTSGTVHFQIYPKQTRFYRAELYRQLLPSLPPMLCLLTNPLYFS